LVTARPGCGSSASKTTEHAVVDPTPQSAELHLAMGLLTLLVGFALFGLVLAHQAPMRLSPSQAVVAALMVVMLAGSWIWPLRLDKPGRLAVFNPEQAPVAVLLLSVTPAVAMVVFALSRLSAAAVKRRGLAVELACVGASLAAFALAEAVDQALGPPKMPLHALQVYAAMAAVAAFSAVGLAVHGAGRLAYPRLGLPPLGEDLGVRLGVVGSGLLLGCTVALAINVDPWAVAVAAPFLVVARLLGEAQFGAYRDRARLRGLLDLAVEAAGTYEAHDLRELVTSRVRTLLRVRHAELRPSRPQGSVSVALSVGASSHWLAVSGRAEGDLLTRADELMLNAVAVVAGGALSRAEAFERVREERRRLASIAINLVEGVCALDAEGMLSFVNPAAARLLDLPVVGLKVDEPVAAQAILAPACLIEPALEVIRLGRPIQVEEAVFVRASGEPLDVGYSASPLFDAGRVVGL